MAAGSPAGCRSGRSTSTSTILRRWRRRRATICSYSASRRLRASTLLSRSPRIRGRAGRMTAAAHDRTGEDPRPTSSRRVIRRNPARRSLTRGRDGRRGVDGPHRRRASGGSPALIGSARDATLAENGRLADAVAQEAQPGAAGDTVTDDLDLVDAKGMTGKVRSTPMPLLMRRTVMVWFTPPPRIRMTVPSNTWTRSRLPSTTLTETRTVSPGAIWGISVRSRSLPAPGWGPCSRSSLTADSTPDCPWD